MDTAGDRPSEFLLDPGASLGMSGQQIEYPLDLDHVWDVRTDLPALFGVPDFLWVAGDGNTPTYGPALSVTGAPTPGKTPWQDPDGDAVVSEVHTGASYRASTASFGLAAGEDLVIILRGTHPIVGGRYASSRSAATGNFGWDIYWTAVGPAWGIFNATGNYLTPAIFGSPGALTTFVCVYSRVTNTAYLCGNIVTTRLVTDSPIAGKGISLGALVDGVAPGDGGIADLAIYQGVGIAAPWLADSYAQCKRLTRLALGYEPQHGQGLGATTHARASAALGANRDGDVHIFSSGMPRCGDSDLLTADPAVTNYCFNTVNIAAATGWTATGGMTLNVDVDDSTAMAAAATGDVSALGSVAEAVNATGGPEYLHSDGPIGVTTACHLMAYARTVAGSGIRLGWYDVSASTFQDIGPIVEDYDLTRLNNTSPDDTDCVLAFLVPDGATLRMVAPHSGRGAISPAQPIPNFATAAAAAGAADVLTTPWTPSDGKGAIEADITPVGWNAGDVGTTRVVERSGGTAGLIYHHPAQHKWTFYDGTKAVYAGAPADGVELACRIDWGPYLKITAGSASDVDTYDGALLASGTIELVADAAPVRLGHLRCYREPS